MLRFSTGNLILRITFDNTHLYRNNNYILLKIERQRQKYPKNTNRIKHVIITYSIKEELPRTSAKEYFHEIL